MIPSISGATTLLGPIKDRFRQPLGHGPEIGHGGQVGHKPPVGAIVAERCGWAQHDFAFFFSDFTTDGSSRGCARFCQYRQSALRSGSSGSAPRRLCWATAGEDTRAPRPAAQAALVDNHRLRRFPIKRIHPIGPRLRPRVKRSAFSGQRSALMVLRLAQRFRPTSHKPAAAQPNSVSELGSGTGPVNSTF